MTISAQQLDAYLTRIGYAGPLVPTVELLNRLQYRHTTTIPFENLDVLLGRPIMLDVDALIGKLVHGRRGGYCFEQNGVFARVLATLGFEVTPLAARVRLGVPDGVATGRTHMLLKVTVNGAAYIVDTGFGGLNPTAPLLLIPEIEQTTTLETFRFVEHDAGFEMQARLAAVWAPLYRFTEEPQAQIDYDIANWFVSTSPASRFVQNLTLALPGPDRRATLLNNELTIRHRDGRVEEVAITDTDHLGQAMARYFNLDLFAIVGDTGLDAIAARCFPGKPV